MFEIAELGHSIKKSVYNDKTPELRTQLLQAQEKIKQSNFSVIILISGVDGGGKGEVINLLNEWMDPRYMRTIAFAEPSDEEQERPKFWRYWRTLPAKGTVGIYVGSWYSDPLSKRVYGDIDDRQLHLELIHIRQLEKELIDDGTLVIKCWLHLKKSEQNNRLKILEKNPDTQWQVTERDKKHLGMYDDFVSVAENVLSETSTGSAPWLIVDGSDIRYSSLTVGQHVLSRIEQHIKHREDDNQSKRSESNSQVNEFQINLLDSLDLSLNLEKKQYNA
ncbi:MAG: polyphosphate:AMP phosphotransferase, partial [Methylomarinum sp.]|nr:polyphosphate:AMP phosphotransferase [Methylomarinum sp.]